jgi:probable F420-dependent oxidoreductase
VKFWQALSFTEPGQLVELACMAEEIGFDGVFLSDHLFHPSALSSPYPYSEDGTPPFPADTAFPDTWSVLGAVAAATSKLKLSSSIYILPLRHPLEVAKACATLALLSDGRFALGAGTGWMKEEFDQLGVDFKSRGRRMDEMIAIMRRLWTGEELEWHGEFFDFAPLRSLPAAPAGGIPVYTGGRSRRALKRAASTADGYMGAGDSEESAFELLDSLAAFRLEAGRENLPFECVLPLSVPPAPGLLARLEEKGASSTVSYPLSYSLGPRSSLDEKRRAMELYAETVIGPSR